MHIIEQKLVVQDWPLKEPGDEKFFGYIVALGVFPGDWSAEAAIGYADFAYGETYTRYRIPDDDSLHLGLLRYLEFNLQHQAGGYGLAAKVWIRLTETGYEVDLP